ncbi:MAG: 4Fe-4S binding protein [Clostridia bacterium]|nr:4Fe-4S binding protein [Clostridia bacterium]
MITINSLYCKGCGYCIAFCPKHILEMGKERSVRGFFYPVQIDESACNGCGICALMCPEAAIEVADKK